MSVLRDGRALKEEVQRRLPLQARRLGVDGSHVRVKGKGQGVLVAVEMGLGLPLLVLAVDEKNPWAVASALRPLVAALGVEVLVSDDLGSYRTVAEELGLRHQVCAFHLLRWAGRALSRLREKVPAGWQGVVEEAWGLVRARPPDGGKRLFALYRQVVQGGGNRKAGPLWELAQVLLRLAGDGGGIPWTGGWVGCLPLSSGWSRPSRGSGGGCGGCEGSRPGQGWRRRCCCPTCGWREERGPGGITGRRRRALPLKTCPPCKGQRAPPSALRPLHAMI